MSRRLRPWLLWIRARLTVPRLAVPGLTIARLAIAGLTVTWIARLTIAGLAIPGLAVVAGLGVSRLAIWICGLILLRVFTTKSGKKSRDSRRRRTSDSRKPPGRSVLFVS